MRKVLIALPLVASLLAGCSTQQAKDNLDRFTLGLTNFNAKVAAFAPIIGKDLLLVGQIIVQAECSPLTSTAGVALGNSLNVVAPNSSAAADVSAFFATNARVAAQLCPLVASYQVAVGKVPVGRPSQVIPATP